MNKDIIEMLKRKDIAEKVLIANDSKEIEEVMGINAQDAEDLFREKEEMCNSVYKMSDEEIEGCSGGLFDGVVHRLSDKLDNFLIKVDDKRGWIGNYSDRIVEGGLTIAIVGTTIFATLGAQKIVNYCKNKFANSTNKS